jgi:hypothetical protein
VVHGRARHDGQQQPALLHPQPLHLRRAAGQVRAAAGLRRVRREGQRLHVQPAQRALLRAAGGHHGQRHGQVPRELSETALGPRGLHDSRSGSACPRAIRPPGPWSRTATRST